MARKKVSPTKLFVIDTNVFLHDPQSFLRFSNNDVAVPFVTLEELDKHKVGTDDINRNARAACRLLEQATHQRGSFSDGFALKAMNGGGATGKLYLLQDPAPQDVKVIIDGKADNRILSQMMALLETRSPETVVLVSKDINLRVKARALNFNAEDYLHDQAVEDTDLLPSGFREMSHGELEDLLLEDGVTSQRGIARYTLHQPKARVRANEFVLLEDDTIFRATDVADDEVTLVQDVDYRSAKNQVFGINARNVEQSYALSLLLDPDIDFVTLLGQAGTGKTLLTLAAGLAQVLDEKRYHEIIFTRSTIPMGEDIGFLPGTEAEKLDPWMGALHDNLEVLSGSAGQPSDWHKAVSLDLIRAKVSVKAMNFMRGRTLHNRFVVIDEAQNLTPKQMKSLITRAGDGTKVVCLGNLQQIDHAYLSETSSGLTYAVDRFKTWPHQGHLILPKGERSRLANFANENL